MPCARYTFLTLRDADQGRALLSRVTDQVSTAAPTSEPPASSLYMGVPSDGLRALGVADQELATFPEEFRVGMPARAALLGDRGASHPDNWEDGLASPDLHLAVIVFARDE